MKRKLVVAAALVTVAAGGWWGVLRTPPPYEGTSSSVGWGSERERGSPPPPAAARNAVTPAHDDFLIPDLIYRLEALLLEAGPADNPAVLKARLAGLATVRFPREHATRAAQLAERYVDYRVALGELKRPADDDPQALRSAIDARRRLRERHFTPEEYDALFAQQDELDRFALARLEIARNADLSEAQKQAALRDAESELGAAERAARAQSVQHIAIGAQTAAFDAQGTNAADRYAQRSAQYGDAAAQRLAQLDAQQHDWQARLDAYAAVAARQPLPADLEQLKRQLFTPAEQLRLDAALRWRSLRATQ